MRDSIRYVSVAVPTPLRSTFQYRLTAHQLAPAGARVVVPFGNRKLVGVVTGSDTEAKLADLQPAAPAEPKLCGCGMTNPPAANFCRNCGEPFGGASPV